MALYLGSSEKLKISLNGVVYCLNLLFEEPVERGIRLLSSDGLFLKDSNELYITVKESE